MQKKLDDFINNRQSTPIRKVYLHNDGSFGALPESYYDVQAIDSSPTSLGQQRHTFGDFFS